MCTPIWEAVIHIITLDLPVTPPSGSSNQGGNWAGNMRSDDSSWCITPTPDNATILGGTPNPNPGDMPNPSGNPNPNSDDHSGPSNHESFQSSHSRCGKVSELKEMIANAMSKLVDFITKDKQEAPVVKVWDPDLFDRSNLNNLCGFLLKWKLNFQAQPHLFYINRGPCLFGKCHMIKDCLKATQAHPPQASTVHPWKWQWPKCKYIFIYMFISMLPQREHITVLVCNSFTLLLRFSQFTKRTVTRYIINGVL